MMISPYYQTEKTGTKIHLKVTANTSKNEICGVVADTNGQQLLKIKVTAIAQNGKANKILLKFLSKEWGISANNITIIAGKTSRRKIILVEGNWLPSLVGLGGVIPDQLFLPYNIQRS